MVKMEEQMKTMTKEKCSTDPLKGKGQKTRRRSSLEEEKKRRG
jgi:hypothetical protein